MRGQGRTKHAWFNWLVFHSSVRCKIRLFALISILFSLSNKPRSLNFNHLRFCFVNFLGVLWQSNFFSFLFIMKEESGFVGSSCLIFFYYNYIFMISVLNYKSILLIQSWLLFHKLEKKGNVHGTIYSRLFWSVILLSGVVKTSIFSPFKE